MAITNYERVGKALEYLRAGLIPFVKRELEAHYGKYWITEVSANWSHELRWTDEDEPHLDVALILRIMWEQWNDVFKRTLGHAERSLVSELREFRNRWAHQNPFTSDDAYRVLDSVHRLLSSISAPQAAEVETMKRELLRVVHEEQARHERRKTTILAIESSAVGYLKPWREVVTPHPDVASGRYQQTEFAADLWQVYMGLASAEYGNPVEFFRRTYITESLHRLLVNGLRRLSGIGGDPVVQLQTNFGGGKTHSMLALYHLFAGTYHGELMGIDEVLQDAGVEAVPQQVRRVVLVGNRISPASPDAKPDGTLVRTLWGELAWQLGGREAYEVIRADDEQATNPGDLLRVLFERYGPCLILIDEWVAYARQLHDDVRLPSGTFETQFTFAQALTESVKAVKNCLLVISLPASDLSSTHRTQSDDAEVGGQRGREALHRLQNVIGRVDVAWRPASAEEGFEIVRRRLFEPLITREQFVARDAVARTFHEFYREHQQEFPAEAKELDYERRIKAAYPIHPEIFDRLYTDWSTLVRFQRTRGVLRLMAAVINSLWERGDRNPLIMPATIPLDDPRVLSELTRFLDENWLPIIERDVDGPTSLPLSIDRQVPNLNRYSATRRVARTIYLGSAPTHTAPNRGVEDRRINLGCVMPGESPAVFGDALRRLSTQATYLYQDGTRYWYSTQPTVTKLAEDRAEQLRRQPNVIANEVRSRIQTDVRNSGDFLRVHVFPQTSQDVPDDLDARLVILGVDKPHTRNGESPALKFAQEILDARGTSPRLYKNTVVFLAPDSTRLEDLEQAVRMYLAWTSIIEDQESLDLTPHQVKQAKTQLDAANSAVNARIPETFEWLLVPKQDDPRDPIGWEVYRLTGQDSLAVRASKRLRNDERLLPVCAGTRLRLEIDRIPLWKDNHVAVRDLVEYFARYPYLPRVTGPEVIYEAIEDGTSLLTWVDDAFAYADSYDEVTGRYRGLKVQRPLRTPGAELKGLLVRPDVAYAQIQGQPETPYPQRAGGMDIPRAAVTPDSSATTEPRVEPEPERHVFRRFHGSVTLNPTTLSSDAGKIAVEVISHLVARVGAKVRVTLDVEADLPDGVPEHVVRIVTENCRTLKFDSHGFERE